MPRLLLVIPLLAMTACSSSRKDLTVALTYRPERERSGQYTPLAESSAVKLAVPPVLDERPDKTMVGENTELDSKPPRPVFASGQSPAEFVSGVLVRELATAGLPASDAAQANRVLQLRLTEFFTTESSRYYTSVRGLAELRDAQGRMLWSAPVVGLSERFGNSLSAENYNEGFSDATLVVVRQIVNDPGFRKEVIPR